MPTADEEAIAATFRDSRGVKEFRRFSRFPKLLEGRTWTVRRRRKWGPSGWWFAQLLC